MPRSVWKGTLSFGLVAIPVSLYPATEAKDVRFHLFDREGRRVRYRRVVESGPSLGEPGEEDVGSPPAGTDADEEEGPEETEVAYEDLVRGYEIEPESYVFLETAEIERARPSPSRVIDLEQFVRLEEIDPVYFEKAYYVVPGPGAERSYDRFCGRCERPAGSASAGSSSGRSLISSRSGRWSGSSRSRRCTSATRCATPLGW